MPTLAKLMNEEIRRLARREAKALAAGIKKDTIRLKRDNADLKRRVAQLERDNKKLGKALGAVAKQAPKEEDAPKRRLGSRNIRALRKKLGLSQAKFANLIGVTTQSIYNWEAKDGVLRLRADTLDKVLAARGMSAAQAKDRLVKLDSAAKARAARKTKRKRTKRRSR